MPDPSFCRLTVLVASINFTASLPALGGDIGPLPLLVSNVVQKEIELTEDQKPKVIALHKEYMDSVKKLRADIILDRDYSALSDTERAKWKADFNKINEDFEPKTRDILNPEQFQRAQQITWQVQGPLAFYNPDVIDALEITTAQRQDIAEISETYTIKQQALIAARAASSKLFAKLRDEQTADIVKSLTRDQADKWTHLKGKPFDFSTIPNQRFYRYPWE